MEDRVETLRRHIALYRRCLADGVPADLAVVYLAEIDRAELEIRAQRHGEMPDPQRRKRTHIAGGPKPV